MPALLLQDTSVLINLLATGRFDEIAVATDWQFAVCRSVENEAKAIWNPDLCRREEISLKPFIGKGLLLPINLESDEERDTYVELCGQPGLGDGEAMCIALAQSRGIPFATDDRKATRVSLACQPPLTLVSTPEVLMNWQDRTSLPEAEMGQLILRIEARSKFILSSNHSCFDWWQQQKLIVSG
jgi:predicted nucleic acid-binding protein